MMAEPCVDLRSVWAVRIREAYGQTVEAVFQVGRELLQAKQALPHGEFMRMVEKELPFSADTAQRYMAISSASHLQIPRIARHLPSSWYTLHVLQRLDVSTFDAAVTAGKIHPEMTRADAEALLPPKPLAPVVPLTEAQRASYDAALSKAETL